MRRSTYKVEVNGLKCFLKFLVLWTMLLLHSMMRRETLLFLVLLEKRENVTGGGWEKRSLGAAIMHN